MDNTKGEAFFFPKYFLYPEQYFLFAAILSADDYFLRTIYL